MVSLKRTLAGGLGLAIGIVTLRRLRRRRADPREEAEVAAREALDEAAKAAEHSAASLEHARVAGEKAVEATSEELDTVRDVVAEDGTEPQRRGIRGRARRLIRR